MSTTGFMQAIEAEVDKARRTSERCRWREQPKEIGWHWFRRNGQITVVLVTPGFLDGLAAQFFDSEDVRGLQDVPPGEWQPIVEPRDVR